VAAVLATAAALLYIAFFAWLSVTGHRAFRTSAMDLGYTDQVVWNTSQGRLFQFSTYRDAAAVVTDLPLERIRRSDILLSYHVELLLAAMALFYHLHASPLTLLIVQSAALGLGALPVFWLARARLHSGGAALAFALAYLLAPALEAANLSDFHAVSLSAPLLLLAFYALDRRRHGLFILSVLLAMSAKEDIPLLVFMIGLYVAVVRKERAIGALAAVLGLGWFVLCTRLILPYFSGLDTSPFLARMAIFAPTVQETVRAAANDPSLLRDWLRQPQIVAYVAGLLSSAGFMSLFSPLLLLAGAPVAAVNIFSTWSWTYSEGAHYSASLVPFVIVSAIYGMERLAGWLSRRDAARWRYAVLGLSALMLAISIVHHHHLAVTPLARNFHPPRIAEHERVLERLIAMIPPQAAVSAPSRLYPHLSQRQRAYLFPVINDAEYVLLDVTSSTYPLSFDQATLAARNLLGTPWFHIVAAEDGCVLLRRNARGAPPAPLPTPFYSFALPKDPVVGHRLSAYFGDALELVGYDYTIAGAVHNSELPATVTTYWRALRTIDAAYTFAFFFTRRDGANVGQFAGDTATTAWYPLRAWQPGQIVRIETPELPIGRLYDVLLTVTSGKPDPTSAEGRLPLSAGADRLALSVVQDGTLLKLFSFQQR
jgi:uncharacterized membrane protein